MIDIDATIQQAIQAIRANRRQEARALLEQVIAVDEKNEQAWLWLSGCVEAAEEQLICLENVLTINPNNAKAKKGIDELRKRTARPTNSPFSGGSQGRPGPANDPFAGSTFAAPPPASPPYVPPSTPTSVEWGGGGVPAHGSGKRVQGPSEEEYDNWMAGLGINNNNAGSGSSGGGNGTFNPESGPFSVPYTGDIYTDSAFSNDPFGTAQTRGPQDYPGADGGQYGSGSYSDSSYADSGYASDADAANYSGGGYSSGYQDTGYGDSGYSNSGYRQDTGYQDTGYQNAGYSDNRYGGSTAFSTGADEQEAEPDEFSSGGFAMNDTFTTTGFDAAPSRSAPSAFSAPTSFDDDPDGVIESSFNAPLTEFDDDPNFPDLEPAPKPAGRGGKSGGAASRSGRSPVAAVGGLSGAFAGQASGVRTNGTPASALYRQIPPEITWEAPAEAAPPGLIRSVALLAVLNLVSIVLLVLNLPR